MKDDDGDEGEPGEDDEDEETGGSMVLGHFWHAKNTVVYRRNSPLFMEPKVHYRVHPSRQTITIASQINLDLIPTQFPYE
jgi:hypothetical protein